MSENTNELQNRSNVDRLNDKMNNSSDGLFDALEKEDKIILLDFSGSMSQVFEGKELYEHLVDAVRMYEREYIMISFRSEAKTITDLSSERPCGSTDLTDALAIANGHGAGEYVVVSDGVPNRPQESMNYAIEHKMKCSTIFLGDHINGKKFMNDLASLTGGKSDNIQLLGGFGGMLEKKIKGLIEG